MKRKQILCILCAAAVLLTSAPYTPEHAYGSEPVKAENKENIWEDETGSYEVLEQDSQGRELVARSGDSYITTEYDDAAQKTIQYYSQGPLEGNNFTQKTTVQEIEENEFCSVMIVTTETESGTVVEEYDKDDNLTRYVSKDGNVKVNEYQDGNLLKVVEPYTGTEEDALHTATYEYDAAGNKTAEYSPAALNEDGSISYFIQKYTYDEKGNRISYQKTVNDPGEAEAYVRTDYEYDEDRNMVKTTEYDKDGSVLAIAQFVYDEDGNKIRQYTGLTSPLVINGLDQVTPGADKEYNVTSYEYEDGQLVKETDPEGNSVVFRYGEDGMLAEKIDKDGTRYEYTYREGVFRESEKVFYPGNETDIPDETKQYIQEEEEDGSYGMLTEIRENGKSVQYSYNGDGSLAQETDQNGNKVSFEYDEGQNLVSITVEDKNKELIGKTGYDYNKDGSLAEIKDKDGQTVVAYDHSQERNQKIETAGNGNRTEYNYDINGLPVEMKIFHGEQEKAAEYKYEYAVDGTMKEETEQVQGTGTAYDYDGMGRLKCETQTDGEDESVVQYSYDESGNRTRILTEEEMIQNEYDGANRLTDANGENVSYDQNGNLTRWGDRTYTYDVKNRLVQVQSQEHTISYEYDVNGRLIGRNADGAEEQFVWAQENLIAKIGEAATYYYTDLGAEVKASESEEGKQYYASGKRGDILEVTDESGDTAEQKGYSALGELKAGGEDRKAQKTEESSGSFELGYTGSFYDEETELVYLNARFYSPELGCFLSEDTLSGDEEELMTLNRYAYCKQDPVNYVDPSGHWSKNVHKAMSKEALSNSGYGSNQRMNNCISNAVSWADDNFHYENESNPLKDTSERSKQRMGIASLQAYCDKDRAHIIKNSQNGYKENRFWAPYHGRGEYYKYLPYLLGLALQFQKGYRIENLALRNDTAVYQQMNFDMLIHLSGLYEYQKEKETGNQYILSRQEYSYLILGIALHLVEDLWAHVAVINDTKADLDANKKYFTDVEELKSLLYTKKLPLSYLHLFYFCPNKTQVVNGKEKKYYNIMHGELAEGNRTSAVNRRVYAKNAAERLLYYYKNGYIMHSGNQKLTGTDQANASDKQKLNVSKCARGNLNVQNYRLKNGKTIQYGRYVCGACEEGKADACYRIYYYDKGKGKGLAYMLLPTI